MKNLGYYQSRADQSVRSKLADDERTIACTYTDDIAGMNDAEEGYRRAVKELGSDFDIKKLKSVIGLNICKEGASGDWHPDNFSRSLHLEDHREVRILGLLP